MNILIVDDEPLVLEDFRELLIQALDQLEITEYAVYRADSERAALAQAEMHRIDTAFLDIHLSGRGNGIHLASKLQEMYPRINLIFTTAYKEHIFEALPLHFSGYLLKPIERKEIVDELRSLRYGRKAAAADSLYIQCFGNFEVYFGGRPVHFARSKTKELLAYLIDRRGSAANASQICAAIFEDFTSDNAHKTTLRVLGMELKHFLEAAGYGDIYIHKRNSYVIVPERLPCDLYRYEAGEEELYQGKYMEQYNGWAWFRKE